MPEKSNKQQAQNKGQKPLAMDSGTEGRGSGRARLLPGRARLLPGRARLLPSRGKPVDRGSPGGSPSPKIPSLELSLRATAGKQYVPYLKKYLRRVHAMTRSHLAELSIALVGDTRMSQLHLQFMGIAGPTDVLSFPLETDNRGRATSGEIVICVPEARRQARQRKIPVPQELLLYAVHGILHLNGFDDRTDAEYRIMHRMEDRILTDLGIGATFEPGGLKSKPARTRAKGGR